jgi:hypothetical protein
LDVVFAGERSRQVFAREVPTTLSTLSCPGARGRGLEISFTAGEEDTGRWDVFIQAQPTGRRADTSLRVREPEAGPPDLTVQILGIDRFEIVNGAEPWTWITYRVTNQGQTEAPAQVRLRVWSNGQARSGYMEVPGPLPAGAVVEQRFAAGHDSAWPPGEYSVVLEVDYPNQVEESNEGNNRSNAIQFLVIAPEEERAATIEDFLCDWRNTDPDTGGTTRVDIYQQYDQVMVHGYGKCTPTDCDWGTTSAYLEGSTLFAEFEFSFLVTRMAMTREEDRLRVYSVNTFTDGSGRDYNSTEYFSCTILW